MNLIEIWRNRGRDDNIATKKLFSGLSKSKSRLTNELADKLHSEVFREIDCLDCANCCKSIPPLVNEMDVRRASKYLGIKTGIFKENYLIIDEDDDMIINSSPCPFLLEDNTCEIYEARPRACREYPHTNNHEFMKNIRLHKKNFEYCPGVYHILKRLHKANF